MKQIILVWLCALSLAVAVEDLSDTDKKLVAEANKLVERGNKFIQDSSPKRAKSEYEKALRIFPRHVDALYNLAIACEKLGQNEEAVAHYRHYLEIRPNDADVWTQLGVRYDETGNPAEARKAYNQALTIDPKFGLAHHNLGVLLKEQGDLDGAQKHLETFVRLEEEGGRHNGDAYYSLGTLYLARGNSKEAKRLFQQALDVDPSIPYYNNAMASAYLAEGESELAISAFKKALEKDAKHAPAYCGLGDAYLQKGDRVQAEKSYRQALELRNDFALAHYRLGLLLETTHPAEAIKEFSNYLNSAKHPQFQTEAKAKIEQLSQANTK